MKITSVSIHRGKNWKGMDRHTHSKAYQIDYFHSGKGKYWIGDIWEEFTSKDIFLIPPFTQHQIECNLNFFLDNFSLKFILRQDENLSINFSPYKISIPEKMEKEFFNKIKIVSGYYVMGKNIPEYLLRDILSILNELIEKSKAIPLTIEEKIEKIKKIIDYNYSLPIKLTWLAKKVEISPDYLCRAFKKITGENIWEYLNKTRMENSLKLLETTDMPIKQIIGKCGFKNVYYFNTSFKKYFSIPPGKIRTINREIRKRQKSL